MEFHFSTSLLLNPAGNRQKTMQKIEDRKAIRKSARRTFLSLTTCSEQHPRKRESQGADA